MSNAVAPQSPVIMSEAVGSQADHQRVVRGEADLTAVLIASISLSHSLAMPAPLGS